MKALTISEPYASMIIHGRDVDGLPEKFIENRRWPTRYRGPLAIHAGKGTQYLSPAQLEQYPAGKVLGTVEMVGCFHIDTIRRKAVVMPLAFADGTQYTWAQLAQHKHAEGPWCHVYAHRQALNEPVPAKGKQGFWEWSN